MDELATQIQAAQEGDLAAYGEIVRRFQDLAYGCAYAVLSDFHLAEDAAQEAFIDAYRKLGDLREPRAFPGWLRRIVLTKCGRIIRRKQVATVPLEQAAETQSPAHAPDREAQRMEMRDAVVEAIQSLPEGQRMATTLFYINGYSQAEVADFLEVPVSTVKKRLHDSRRKLKERMVDMVAEELKSHALPGKFPERVRLLLELPRPLQIEGHPVRQMWEKLLPLLPGFEVIEVDEVLDTDVSLLGERYERHVYRIDDSRVLRAELTSQLFDRWLQEGGGERKWIVAGRVFRANHVETETVLEVHHQAEALWHQQGLTAERCAEEILVVARKLLPNAELRLGDEMPDYALCKGMRWYEGRWRNRWLRFGAGGVVADEWVEKAGLAPGRDSVLNFAFGLERCSQVAFDLDDIRKLWRPPYVPADAS